MGNFLGITNHAIKKYGERITSNKFGETRKPNQIRTIINSKVRRYSEFEICREQITSKKSLVKK